MLNKLISRVLPHLPKDLIWLFSRRYIAGVTLHEAIEEALKLNRKGIKVSVDLLGEQISNIQEAENYKDSYLETIQAGEKYKLDATYSIKPTMFGLLEDEEKCYQFIKEIVVFAKNHNKMVRLDMEDSKCVDKEIRLFEKLYNEFPANVGIVLQAYLRRTFNDLEYLNALKKEGYPINIRICKGIYIEPEEIAFKKKNEINHHFFRDVRYMFEHDMYPGIATHDRKLIRPVLKYLKDKSIPTSKYEFQMLYGVTPSLRKKIVSAGHTMRVYLPYGKDWFNYSTRRLKENPRMINHIIKSLFIRG